MMTVEEKPDITYSDIGGCKEQIDKMREVREGGWVGREGAGARLGSPAPPTHPLTRPPTPAAAGGGAAHAAP